MVGRFSGSSGRGDVAARLVEHEIAVPLGPMQQLAVDADVVLAEVGLGAERGDGLAVHLHAAFEDDGLCRATRGDARLREDFLRRSPVAGPRAAECAVCCGFLRSHRLFEYDGRLCACGLLAAELFLACHSL